MDILKILLFAVDISHSGQNGNNMHMIQRNTNPHLHIVDHLKFKLFTDDNHMHGCSPRQTVMVNQLDQLVQGLFLCNIFHYLAVCKFWAHALMIVYRNVDSMDGSYTIWNIGDSIGLHLHILICISLHHDPHSCGCIIAAYIGTT